MGRTCKGLKLPSLPTDFRLSFKAPIASKFLTINEEKLRCPLIPPHGPHAQKTVSIFLLRETLAIDWVPCSGIFKVQIYVLNNPSFQCLPSFHSYSCLHSGYSQCEWECICLCIRTWACRCVCVPIRDWCWVSLSFSPPYVLRQSLSRTLELTDLVGLIGQCVSGDPPPVLLRL